MLIGVLTYVGLQVLFGLFIARRVRSEEDYLLGGRRIGPLLATFTIFATWFGAETCIGAAAQAYSGGLSAVAVEPFGYALCLLLMGLAFAVPLWRLKLTTLADLFRERFGASAEKLSVMLMVPTSILWAAAQIRAFGQILAATSSLEVEVAVAIAAGVVIFYTALGGFLADAVSDLVQGLVLAIGLLVIAVASTLNGGSMDAIFTLPAKRLASVVGGTSMLDLLELLAIPILGSVFAQELVARVIASRSPTIARRSTLSAAGIYLFIGLIPVTLGMTAAASGVALDHPEQVLVRVAGEVLPGMLYVVFAGALVSAILSTVDSALLVAGSLVAHNVILPLRRGASERWKVWINRSAVVGAGILAYGLTRSHASVWDLVVEASGFGSAGIFVAATLGMLTRIGGSASALASLGTGVVVYVLGAHITPIDHPFLASLVSSLVAYATFALPVVVRLPLPQRQSQQRRR